MRRLHIYSSSYNFETRNLQGWREIEKALSSICVSSIFKIESFKALTLDFNYKESITERISKKDKTASQKIGNAL